MPVTVSIKQRKVQLNAETSLIVECYREALVKNKFMLNDGDGERKSYAALGVTQFRLGIGAKFTALLERVTESPRGAKCLALDAVDIELQDPAALLLRDYIAFLNKTLLAQGLSSTDTEAEEITSRFVLIRELLYRLAGLALSNKINGQNDGDNLVTALTDFMDKITDKELMAGKHWISGKSYSPFLAAIANNHSQWVRQIRQRVSIVEVIRNNCQTISNTLNWLGAAEQTIQRQLIAFINERVEPNALTQEWLDTTLEDCEAKLLIKGQNTSTEGCINSLIIGQGLELTEKQLEILTCLPTSKDVNSITIKIGALYDLLNRTYFLHEIMANIDLLMTCLSWMPILVGAINFKSLVELTKDYNNRCENVLKIPEELQPVIQARVGLGLAKYKAITSDKLIYLGFKSIDDLNNLQDGVLKQRVGNMIVSALSSLMRLQSNLSPAFHFIDSGKANNWLQLSTNYQPLPAKAIEWRDRLHENERRAVGLNERYELLKEENLRLRQDNVRVVDKPLTEQFMTQLLHINLIDECKSVDVLEMLRARGADLRGICNLPNAFNSYTPLHIAASTNNLFACKWLLEQGVDVNIETNSRETALDKASKRALREIIDYLKGRGGRSMLIQGLTQQLHEIIDDENITEDSNSVTQAHLERLNDLVNHGADVDGINESRNAWNGDRPLHTLLVKRNQRLIEWVMSVGANPDLLHGHANRAETPYERFCRVVRPVHQGSMKTFLDTNFPGRFLPVVVLEQNPVRLREPYCPYYVNKHKNELIGLGMMAIGATVAATYKYYYERPNF